MTFQIGLLHELRRQLDVCRACHYCDGYCDVFPALQDLPTVSDGDIVQPAMVVVAQHWSGRQGVFGCFRCAVPLWHWCLLEVSP
ncbi:hypothetical protein GALL_390610 [mine drainage metagenome]|uniref:Uncharacterized protein n=1 Tax=mine drainage metagenome TaxID=410659 RepID=A0A1J5Q6B6_9ZZZZ